MASPQVVRLNATHQGKNQRACSVAEDGMVGMAIEMFNPAVSPRSSQVAMTHLAPALADNPVQIASLTGHSVCSG
jgi:hypothetical protein